MPLIHPPALKPGDTVAIISPSGPVTRELVEPGIAQLRAWGLEARVLKTAFARGDHRGYLAGDDELRLNALVDAILDPEINAIFCTRGGYGAMRLLPALARSAEVQEYFTQNPKLLVGFSDITALHLYFSGVLGVATLHGPVLKSFGLHQDDPLQSLESLRRAVFGGRLGGLIPGQSGPNFGIRGLKCEVPGTVQGPVFAGNLSLLASLVGAPYCPDLNGAILAIEDVGEEDYRLDRLFTALRLAQKSARPAGIVLGDFTSCGGVYIPDRAIPGFVAELAGEFGCPVVSGFPFGHASRNIPIPMGCQATLDASAGALIFERDAALPSPKV